MSLYTVLHLMLFAIASLSISSASLFVRLSSASATACAFWRLAISSSILVLILSTRSRPRYSPKTLAMCIASGVSLGLHFVLWMDSLFRVPVAVSVAIVVLYPLHAMVIEIALLRERFSILRLFGMSIALAGLAIYIIDAFAFHNLDPIGVVESFIASILAAIYFCIGRAMRREIDVYSYTVPTYFIGATTVLLYSLAIQDNVFTYLHRSWIWFLALALVPMIGGHTVMNYLLKFYRSSTVTSIALLEPILATVLVYLVIGEQPPIEYIVAMIAIVIGVSVIVYEERIFA